MPVSFSIGTYNFENFFSRAILMNRDRDKMAPYLEKVAALQQEISEAKYDKARIRALYQAVKPYVEVMENKGSRLFKKDGSVLPAGRADWGGFIELKREVIGDEAQENTLRVIKAISADVLCVVEVENRPVLAQIAKSSLLGTGGKYPFAMVIDGNDTRGIDVGLLSRYPIEEIRSHVDDREGKSLIFSRDCPEYRVVLPGGRSLFVLCNHLKSQGYGTEAENNARRLKQSKRVAEILKRYDLSKDLVVVAGDLNADPDGPNKGSLAPLISHRGLVDVVKAHLPPADQWAYFYQNKKQRLDYIFCSKPLAAGVQSVAIERRGMWSLGKATGGAQKPFPTVTSEANQASDHGAIVARVVL